MIEVLEQPVLSPSRDGGDDDLVHLYCRDETRSLCGRDLTGHAFETDCPESEMCVVCVDLDEAMEYCGPNCPEDGS
jgi:hypothetical protein